MRHCKRCGQDKDLSEFYAWARGPSLYCKPCTRLMTRVAVRKNKLKYRERVRARDIIVKRVKRGSLIRPKKCDRCGRACKPHGHHEDYGKPLEVDWLCRTCHGAAARANAPKDKVCPKCGEVFSRAEFRGQSYCRLCTNAYQRARAKAKREANTSPDCTESVLIKVF